MAAVMLVLVGYGHGATSVERIDPIVSVIVSDFGATRLLRWKVSPARLLDYQPIAFGGPLTWIKARSLSKENAFVVRASTNPCRWWLTDDKEGNIMSSHARFSLPALILTGALAWMTPLGFAQTAAPPAQSVPDPHHPQAAQGATPAPTPGAMPAGSSQSGMMGGGMDQMMAMMRGMMEGRDAMMSGHVEGRLAFLKTELKITDAQIPQWTRLADALRSTTTSMNGMRQQRMQEGMPTTALARLDLHEKMLSAHLDSLKSMKAALIPLYASFSDEQKKLADELMLGPMGMM